MIEREDKNMFQNMKIGKKLIISFIIVALITSLSGLIGIFIIKKLNTNYSDALVTNGFSQGDIGRFNTALNKGSALVRDIIFLVDEADLQSTKIELDKILVEVDDAFVALKQTCQTPQELELVSIIEENLPKYQTSRQKVIDLGYANKNDAALKAFREETTIYLNKCADAAQGLADLNVTLGNEVSSDLQKQSMIFTVTIVVIVIIALVIAILLGGFVSRSISNPIQACSDRLSLLSDGDLHTTVPEATSNDEVGIMLSAMKITTQTMQKIINDIDTTLEKLANGELNISTSVEYNGDFTAIKTSIDRIIDALNVTFSEINQSADQVASGSDQVASGAQALSQGATEQASSVEELAATINDISSQVGENAKSAVLASEKANAVGTEATESNNRMQDMLGAMAEISNSSSEIGKIIKAIEDIAFQTNILALNAAVEAARAGAAGKGFAVVADEVRNLASKSAEASKNTAVLIESSLKAVENGTKIADETAGSLSVVVEGVKEVTSIIDKISTASNEQARSIQQVTQGVDQISSVVQTNSATAEESAAASEELSGQSQMLKDLISRFKLKNVDYSSMSSSETQKYSYDTTEKTTNVKMNLDKY